MDINSSEITKYCEQHSDKPSALCQELFEYTIKHVPMSVMLVGSLPASLLRFLIKVVSAERVLEIGTYTGYSALSMAESLPEKGELITLDVNKETTEIAKKFWSQSPHGKKIKLILGPALETLPTLQGVFDIIFIDAVKTEYVKYLELCLELLSPTGVIVADNCLYSGEVLQNPQPSSGAKGIYDFNDYVKHHSQLESVLLPVRDGLHLIRKRVLI